jgi:hypothetical protein
MLDGSSVVGVGSISRGNIGGLGGLESLLSGNGVSSVNSILLVLNIGLVVSDLDESGSRWGVLSVRRLVEESWAIFGLEEPSGRWGGLTPCWLIEGGRSVLKLNSCDSRGT